MAITNLQQARQMYQTGQRVAKTLDGSRPGYRGDRGYQGSSGGSKASSSTNQGPAGGATIGSGSKQSGSPKARTTSKTPRDTNPTDINDNRLNYRTSTPYVTSVKPEDVARSKLQFIQKLNNDNAIRANQLGTKFVPYQGGSRPKPRSGLAGLIMSGLGMLMGIPGLGLITGGFNRFKGGLDTLNTNIGDFRERTTGYRTQAEYEAARNQRRLQSRLDKLYSRKNLGKGYSQKNIDMLEAMGLSPTTPQNQDNARGSNLRNILNDDVNNLDLEQGNLNNISSLIAAADQGELEVPGDNLPVLSASPNRNINYNRIQGYTDEYPNLDMEEKTPPYSAIDISNIDKGRGSIIEDMYRSNAYPAETTGIQTVANNENFPLRSDFLVDIKNNQDITTLPAAREAINAMPVDPFDPFSDFKNSQQFQKENLNNPDYYKVINDYTGSKFRL